MIEARDKQAEAGPLEPFYDSPSDSNASRSMTESEKKQAFNHVHGRSSDPRSAEKTARRVVTLDLSNPVSPVKMQKI